MISLKDAGKRYGSKWVLRRFTAEFGPGVHAICGPNGAGKTTLLKLMNGILTPDEGRVLLMGKGIDEYTRKDIAKLVGYVPQISSFDFPLTVEEFVALGSFAGGGDVRGALKTLNIAHLREREVNTLSGGEFQRALIARALVPRPKVLLLDEPTAHLDVVATSRIMELIRQLGRDMCVVFVTHDLNLAGFYADDVILMKNGTVLASGSPEDALLPSTLKSVYGGEVEVIRHPETGRPVVLPPNGAK